MSGRWQRLVLPFAVEEALVNVVFEDLVARYGENGRFYHNLHHIKAVLDHIEPFLVQGKPSIALQLAAWFHDVVYDAQHHDNEAQSASYARQVLEGLGMPDLEIHEVERLIMLTVGHETAVSDTDGHILLDADLAILAADSPQYDAYAQAIRQEYAHVPDGAYRVGRVQVLRRLGERPFLYYLPEHRSWEAVARANLARESQDLTGL